MAQVGEAIRKHHRQMVATLETLVADIKKNELPTGRKLVEFLRGDLLPHAHGEERHLYGLIDSLVKAHNANSTATMCVDHTFLEEQVDRIESAVGRLERSSGSERTAAAAELERLLIELSAVLRLHLRKEEDVYFTLMERYAPEQEQSAALRQMHRVYEEEKQKAARQAESPNVSLDVREIPPRSRHPLILEAFNKLRPGESFLLVNDHDPKPLYYQFQAELTGQFSWNYLEQGPKVWRVQIGRP
jgi:uncharacterized protein (DUF2249 family)/hemerythrin-like domain-containing protein